MKTYFENLKAAQNKNLDIAVKNFVELKGDLQSALLSHKVKKAFTSFSSIVILKYFLPNPYENIVGTPCIY